MKNKITFILSIFLLVTLSQASLINDFITSAKSFWTKGYDLSDTNQLKELPKIKYEIPKQNDEFLKQGLKLINAPSESLNLCYHRVVITLKKKCNELSLEDIGKIAIAMLNCQLEAEGRTIYPCNPEMTLKQCTIGFDDNMYKAYVMLSHRALAICTAIKHEQIQMLTEMTIDRLIETTQSQTSIIHESLKNQRRINEMNIQNLHDYRESFDKIKEYQTQNIEGLSSAKEQINEINSDLQRQLEIHQISEQKLIDIEKSTNEIAIKLKTTNEEILKHYDEALKFLKHFQNIMQMISVITIGIENTFNKIKSVLSEIGLEVTQDFILHLIWNTIFFTCGMIFVIFMNLQKKYRYVLISLFVFNMIASYSKADIPILGVNIIVLFSLLCYSLKQRFSSLHFDLDMLTKLRRNSKSFDKDTSNGYKKMSERQKTPAAKEKSVTPVKKSKEKAKNDDEDSEIADICEREIERIEQQQQQQQMQQLAVQSTVSTGSFRSETPRCATPAMIRVMKTDGVDVNRIGTPFSPGLPGRIQCQALTTKGVQCRNAAEIGYIKCKVHNY